MTAGEGCEEADFKKTSSSYDKPNYLGVIELDTSTRLAYDRTRLAYENTMMAWARTATSLITFGFSVYKFFQIEMKPDEQVKYLVGPREFALLMIAFGLVSWCWARCKT